MTFRLGPLWGQRRPKLPWLPAPYKYHRAKGQVCAISGHLPRERDTGTRDPEPTSAELWVGSSA
jgi:hypothetical protein